jgi:hypothetical protein
MLPLQYTRNINKHQVHLELASRRFVHHESNTNESRCLRGGSPAFDKLQSLQMVHIIVSSRYIPTYTLI